MLNFNRNQKTFRIHNVEIGGLPGERPVVLIGSIFYLGHRILSKDKVFDFNRSEAERLLNMQESFSDKTGNPSMVDLIISSQDAVEVLIDFVDSYCDSPILIDAVGAESKYKSLTYVSESGLKDRVIYNSITIETPEKEIDMIKNSQIDSSILLSYSSKAFFTKARIDTIRELIRQTNKFITKPLIDTYVLDIPSLGMACKAMKELKNELGLPVGAGTENAVSTWKGLKNKMGVQAKYPSIATAAAMAVLSGADFILYGPIENSEYIFPAVALVDAALEQISIEEGFKPNTKLPLFKIA
ncbi:MAG: tetrahydromethanopterin S-methyltransferase subunit H family protein [Candidatus Odinarchaeia archaeon]